MSILWQSNQPPHFVREILPSQPSTIELTINTNCMAQSEPNNRFWD